MCEERHTGRDETYTRQACNLGVISPTEPTGLGLLDARFLPGSRIFHAGASRRLSRVGPAAWQLITEFFRIFSRLQLTGKTGPHEGEAIRCMWVLPRPG